MYTQPNTVAQDDSTLLEKTQVNPSTYKSQKEYHHNKLFALFLEYTLHSSFVLYETDKKERLVEKLLVVLKIL